MMLRLVLVCLIWAGQAQAELNSLFPSAAASSLPPRASLVSLDASSGFFAPLPDRAVAVPDRAAFQPPWGDTGAAPVDRLLSLIARAEAGSAGYDAVQHGARVRPALPPTRMTLGDIYAWIDATPGQPHAIGRYQFIPSTLRRVARVQGFGPDTPFTPDIQDALALVLLEDAGLSAFQTGAMGRREFMHNLARIWAGLPLPSGRSYYDGYAGNAATMTWAAFEGGMQEIWGG